MTDKPPVIVTWNCGACNIIHEQHFEESERDIALNLCANIVMIEDVPDFSVRVLREGVYQDETTAVIVALVNVALRDLFTGEPNE